jgi:hypothetical protein
MGHSTILEYKLSESESNLVHEYLAHSSDFTWRLKGERGKGMDIFQGEVVGRLVEINIENTPEGCMMYVLPRNIEPNQEAEIRAWINKIITNEIP